MLDLLRWHGAEEVEHRALVYDVYHHVGGSYLIGVLDVVHRAAVIGWWVPALDT